MPKRFFCPDCGQELTKNYNVTKVMTTVTHPKPICDAVDSKKGVVMQAVNKKQLQYRNRVNAVATNKKHHQDQSENNAWGYQTAHPNADVQAARVQNARDTGLSGHLSSTSNSKRNPATTQGLNKINKNK
jgi:hypothetical protein